MFDKIRNVNKTTVAAWFAAACACAISAAGYAYAMTAFQEEGEPSAPAEADIDEDAGGHVQDGSTGMRPEAEPDDGLDDDDPGESDLADEDAVQVPEDDDFVELSEDDAETSSDETPDDPAADDADAGRAFGGKETGSKDADGDESSLREEKGEDIPGSSDGDKPGCAPYVQGVVLAALADGVPAVEIQAEIDRSDLIAPYTVTDEDLEMGWALLPLADGVGVSDALDPLSRISVFDYVQPNYIYHLA